MPEFTKYIARITKRLEAGLPVVDVLRYLGDGLGHHPDESSLFAGNMYKCDYLNNDVLMNRLSVKDARIVVLSVCLRHRRSLCKGQEFDPCRIGINVAQTTCERCRET